MNKHFNMWKGRLRTIKETENRIDLKQSTDKTRNQPYWQGMATRAVIADQVNEKQNEGKIISATTEWASPAVLVPRNDGSLGFCVDYRNMNSLTVPDTLPFPWMADCIDSIDECVVVTTLNANCRHWHVAISSEGQNKSTFRMHLGRYRYKCMPIGLRNSPATI